KGAEGTLSDEQEIKIIQKLYKQSKDSMALYQSQNREDLASKEKEEMDIIESFLPKQINDDELNSALTLIIEQVNAKSMADMGKVMGIASKSLAGKAEGARIAAQLKKLLS
ncbi:MAG TPA: GatB/YqeY domain-containing protein, partial [Chitinophagales bacterium]|nr:GatB/YqeY domain-containing protein [Chitinophagales bacterium]